MAAPSTRNIVPLLPEAVPAPATPPTVIGTDLFYHNVFTAPPYPAVVGTPAKDMAIYRWPDPASLLIQASSGSESLDYTMPSGTTIAWHGFWWRMEAADEPTNDVDVARFTCATGAGGRLSFAPASNSLYHFITGASFPSTTYTFGTWIWIEQILDVSSGTRRLRTRVGGVKLTDIDESVASSTVSTSRLGVGTSAGAYKMYYAHQMWGTAVALDGFQGPPDRRAAGMLSMVGTLSRN